MCRCSISNSSKRLPSTITESGSSSTDPSSTKSFCATLPDALSFMSCLEDPCSRKSDCRSANLRDGGRRGDNLDLLHGYQPLRYRNFFDLRDDGFDLILLVYRHDH